MAWGIILNYLNLYVDDLGSWPHHLRHGLASDTYPSFLALQLLLEDVVRLRGSSRRTEARRSGDK